MAEVPPVRGEGEGGVTEKPLLVGQGDLLVALVGDPRVVGDDLVTRAADYLLPVGISVCSGWPCWVRPGDFLLCVVEPILWTQGDGKSEATPGDLFNRKVLGQVDPSLPPTFYVNSYTLPGQPAFFTDQFARMVAHAAGWHCLGMVPNHTPGTAWISCEFPGPQWHPQYLPEQRHRVARWAAMINDGHPGGRPRNVPFALGWRSRFRNPPPVTP